MENKVTKSEADIYKELYEKSQKENEKLKIQAVKTQTIKPITEPTTPKVISTSTNSNADTLALTGEIVALKQTVSSMIQQLNILATEQEKIRTQVRSNYKSITDIAKLINGGN